MSESRKLYDHVGNPLGQGDDPPESSLPAGVQALIETRINSAIADVREHNRDDLQDLARDHARKWRYLALVSVAFGIISSSVAVITTFYAPQQIRIWISSQVDKKLTEPMIRESADRVIADKMSAYVDERLQPLREKADSLVESVDNVRKDVGNKQVELERQQEELSKQLKIRELAVAAKAGSRSSYNALLELTKDHAEPRDLLNASLKEIELFFDADRSQLLFPTLVKASTMKDPGFSVDEVVHILRGSPQLVEAAINTLSNLKDKACVKELCAFVEKTDNLRAAARATRALQVITGDQFRPLEFDKVGRWCTDTSSNPVYSGSYDGYLSVAQHMNHGAILPWQLDDFIKQLTVTCESDPDALHSRCLKAGFFLMLDRPEDAKLIFDEVKKKNSKYRWLLVWEAAERIKAGDRVEAVKLINQAFSVSADDEIEQTINYWNIFRPIRGDENILWPSKKARDSEPIVSAGKSNKKVK